MTTTTCLILSIPVAVVVGPPAPGVFTPGRARLVGDVTPVFFFGADDEHAARPTSRRTPTATHATSRLRLGRHCNEGGSEIIRDLFGRPIRVGRLTHRNLAKSSGLRPRGTARSG